MIRRIELNDEPLLATLHVLDQSSVGKSERKRVPFKHADNAARVEGPKAEVASQDSHRGLRSQRRRRRENFDPANRECLPCAEHFLPGREIVLAAANRLTNDVMAESIALGCGKANRGI
jgi:hypothetical protein